MTRRNDPVGPGASSSISPGGPRDLNRRLSALTIPPNDDNDAASTAAHEIHEEIAEIKRYEASMA